MTFGLAYSVLAHYSSSGRGYDPEVLELEKWRNLLAKQQYQTAAPVDDAPGWNEELASDSEAFVKVSCRPTRHLELGLTVECPYILG